MQGRHIHETNQSHGQREDGIEAVIPNLSWRYSGGTATNQAIAPGLARLLCVAWLGPDRPEGVARLTLRDLLRLRARRPSPVVWHARRNIEMAVGLLLKTLGWPFVLIFTSAGQRHHTAITRWMINRVNAALGADRAAAWAATGLPGHYGIGCFGRVRRQKGTDLFVTAMCRLLPRFPDYTAVVIGATTASHRAFVARLNAQAAAAGLSDRILFLGALPTPDVQRWFGRLSIYAFTSRNEGFGLTLIEAMAAGAALMAARSAAAEVVVADGTTGLLVPPGDVDALTAALEKLMRDPAAAATMGRRARERAVAEFSLDAEVAGIAKLYSTVRSGGRSGSRA